MLVLGPVLGLRRLIETRPSESRSVNMNTVGDTRPLHKRARRSLDAVLLSARKAGVRRVSKVGRSVFMHHNLDVVPRANHVRVQGLDRVFATDFL